jgi:hypothetical protein
MKNLFVVAALLALCFLAQSASVQARNNNQTLTVEQLREDLRIMRGAMEESHVGLYWFISKPEIDRRVEKVSAKLVRPMTAKEFHRELLPIVASVRHGHTTLDLPIQAVGYRLRYLDKNAKYFPFAIKIIKNKLYVVADLTEKGEVTAGTEIIAVNGRPVKRLIEEMRLYLSADGANDTFKIYNLETNFQFHNLLDLIYGATDTFKLDIVENAGKKKISRTISGASPERMKMLYRERVGREIDYFPPALNFKILENKTALLTIRSFYEGQFGADTPDFNAFLSGAFQKIKESQVEDLIIDVRGNEGGNGSYVPVFYSYLADKPFQLPKPTVLASNSISFLKYAENVADDIKAFSQTPDKFVSKAADGSWTLKEEFDQDSYRTFEPQTNRFTGRLYVLTNGGSYSATNGFLNVVYRYHRVEKRKVYFVGEQNGGDNSTGRVSGGQMLQILLPHSKQRLRIPLLGSSQFFATNAAKAEIPDYQITPSIQDVINGKDTELLFVQELIAKERSPKN